MEPKQNQLQDLYTMWPFFKSPINKYDEDIFTNSFSSISTTINFKNSYFLDYLNFWGNITRNFNKFQFIKFSFVQANKKQEVDIIIHFSNFSGMAVGVEDLFFDLEGNKVDAYTFFNNRILYRENAGKKVNTLTKIKNTEVITYNYPEVFLYLYQFINKDIKNLELKMLQFSSIKNLDGEEVRDYYLKTNKISFSVHANYYDNTKGTEEGYDFGQLDP